MSETLKTWLNNEIVLSKVISDIPNDFNNGYLFAELLFKTKQIPNLSLFKNSNNKKDIISNFCYLQKNFLDIGIILDEKSRNDMMNASQYASLIYLYKIKQVISRKNIDLNELKIKESTTIQKLYNKMIFKNNNEKYLHSWQEKYGILSINKRMMKKNYSTLLPAVGKSTEEILEEKYGTNGNIYNEIKSKYNHLNFGEEDIKIIIEEMKNNENKLLNNKYIIKTRENNRKLSLRKNNDKIKKMWEREHTNIEKFKLSKIKESWMPAFKYKLAMQKYFKRSESKNEHMSINFDDNLKFLVDENDKGKKISSEIIMLRMRQKLDDNIKNKKDKEKRERKRLREEKEFMEISSNRNKLDLQNTTKKIISIIKSEEKISSNDKYLEKSKSNNLINKDDNDSIGGNIRSRNINRKKISSESTTFQRFSDMEKTEEQKQIKIGRTTENMNEKLGLTKFSSFSKLSQNDYGIGLFNEYMSLHNDNININDRIKLFKTLIPPYNFREIDKQNIDILKTELNSNNLSNSLPNINNTFDKSTTLNNNEELIQFFEELNKQNPEFYEKEYKKKLNKLNRKKNLISPILYQIIDLTECIWNYQETKKIDLIDNPKWDELMKKFKENTKINEEEQDKISNEDYNETGNYVIDFGDKLTDKDDKKRLDYINYINSFNDLIIPNEMRGKKLPYPELYEEFYSKQNNQEVDIKDYEPNLVESENLYLPRNSKIRNYKFCDIIETFIENKFNYSQNKKADIYNIINKFEKRGKYYYLPIKIVLNGYPLSGKKTQCHLIKEKYRGMKIYDPQKMLRNKVREYLELKAAKEEAEKEQQQKKEKPKPKKDEKTLEERLQDFKPISKIIKPYIEFLDKMNKLKDKEEKKREKEERKKTREKTRKQTKKKIGDKENEETKKEELLEKKQDNASQNNSLYNYPFMLEYQPEKEEILSKVYMKLILYQLEKDFPTDKNSKARFMKNISEKYKEYLNLKEKVKDINNKINEEKLKNPQPTETKTKIKKENKVLIQLNKDLDFTMKNFESTKNSLYTGFIFVNFPKNLEEAEKLENYFTGYVSDFDKGLSESEKKLYNYRDIIDINIKKKTGIEYFSFFDLFIEFKVTSEEMNRRYKGAKYDSLTAIIYHINDNPPPKEDKKIESRLTQGIPYKSKEEVYLEKENYEVNIKSLERLYKAMTNGFGKVYMTIDQMDIDNLRNINNSFETAISNILFNNYFTNIEFISNNINEENTNKNNENKNKGKDEVSSNIKGKEEKLKQELNKDTENSKTNLTFSEEILNELDEFHHCYQYNLKNLNHFILYQKENIISYLNSIQNIFISFLNRKTSKLEIADIYIQKYNDIIKKYPDFMKKQKIIDELSEDIKDVAKSIWISIQGKKLKDIKYLEDLKNSGKKEKECDKFFDYISIIFELEIKKYLLSIEIIIKYYLSKFGMLNDIYGILDTTRKMNIGNKYLFKVNEKTFIYQGIDKHNELKNHNNNKEIKEDKSEEEQKEKLKLPQKDKNEVKSNNNQQKHVRQSAEDKINTLFMNSMKMMIRQDELSSNYIEKIKNAFKYEKDRANNKNVTSKLSSLDVSSRKLNNSLTSRSINKRIVFKKTSSVDFQNDVGSNYEELKIQITKEKRKLKYRLMFLKYFSLRYIKIINDCYDKTYNTLDELIIMSVRLQNNTLNNFIHYLRKSMIYFEKKLNSNIFEFDTYEEFKRHKIDIKNLYLKYNKNFIFNSEQINNSENKEIKTKDFITEREMTYIQLYVYNLNDLLNIYNYIKTFAVDTCDFFVKYDIVYEILIEQYFNNKKYGIYENQKSEDEFDKNILVENMNEENNGICNKILFSSNINYINCLNNFVQFNNNFININELFTSLLILGSEPISPEEFYKLIKEYLPDNKKEEKNIFLTKEEFMELPMWFENDDYLNYPKDENEKGKYLDIYEDNNPEHGENKEQIKEKKNLKINAIKETIFDINAEDNLFELNNMLDLIKKLYNIYLSKSNINNVEDSDKNSTNQRKNKESINKDTLFKITSEDESNINEMNTSKVNVESKMNSSLQSTNKIQFELKKNEKINNIFNVLFN